MTKQQKNLLAALVQHVDYTNCLDMRWEKLSIAMGLPKEDRQRAHITLKRLHGICRGLDEKGYAYFSRRGLNATIRLCPKGRSAIDIHKE